MTCSNPHLDGCPNCITNTEEPRHMIRLADGCDAGYRCSDCGHEWSTAWGCH